MKISNTGPSHGLNAHMTITKWGLTLKRMRVSTAVVPSELIR